MNNLLGALAMFLMLSAVALAGCKNNNRKSDVKKTDTKDTTKSSDEMSKKGEYIVLITSFRPVMQSEQAIT